MTLPVSGCLKNKLLKCVLVGIALVYVAVIGMTQMLQWSVDNWVWETMEVCYPYWHRFICSYIMMCSHAVAISTASVFYRIGGVYDRVNCTDSDQTLSNCSHSLIGGVNPRNRCSTGQFAQVECKGMPASSVSMKFDIPLGIHPPKLTSAVLILIHTR